MYVYRPAFRRRSGVTLAYGMNYSYITSCIPMSNMPEGRRRTGRTLHLPRAPARAPGDMQGVRCTAHETLG